MDIGIVRPVRIEEEMKGSYLDYAMSVITARALPDVRDGLKPVQRRILYAMDELGLRHSAAYKKSARIVGEVLGKYHPHGDAPVYEAMVRMAQDFSMRYMLVDGQGNFGSVDGDPPAAMRYTEARLAPLAEEMLADIDKNTVDDAPNFDDTLKEPRVLPARVPNLIVNGSTGIAVGMATNIPPHNLREIADALIFLIKQFGVALDGGVPFDLVWARAFGTLFEHATLVQGLNGLRTPVKERVAAAALRHGQRPSVEQRAQCLLEELDVLTDVPPDKLMEMVKGPDFPTAAIVLGIEGIRNAYATGHGRVTIRARAHTEDMRGGRVQIVITELPFQVNKATLLEKIAELVRERRVEGISELRDESDRQGMRVVIELRRDVKPRPVLNLLFKYTSMQTTFSVNMLALVDGQPRVLTLKMVLLHYLNHRREVIIRRTAHDLERARQRAHILEGLKIALEHLDEVIATIRRSKDAEAARSALIKNFKLSEIQAQAILDMQLRRLAALERQKILTEYAETLKLIDRLEDLLAHPAKILYLIRDETIELRAKHGDDRRTEIVAAEATDLTEEELIPDQEVVVTFSAKGHVRRILADAYRLQRRGKGPTGVIAREDDPPRQMLVASTRDNLLMFSDRGRAYQLRVSDVPDVGKQNRGLPVGNFISLDGPERIVAAVSVSQLEGHFVVLATRAGEVKRVAATEYASARSGGIIGISVPAGDELLGALLTTGQGEVVLVTAQGQAIRFDEGELRPSGRNSGGVRGIKLADKDEVVSVGLVRPDGHLVVVTSRGFGKRTPMAEYPKQGRGGGGLRAASLTEKNGELVGGRVASDGDELVIASASGTTIRTPVAMVPEMARSKQGIELVSIKGDDKIVAVMLVSGRGKHPDGGKRGVQGGEGPSPSDVELAHRSDASEQPTTPNGGRQRGVRKTGALRSIDTVSLETKQPEGRKTEPPKPKSIKPSGTAAKPPLSAIGGGVKPPTAVKEVRPSTAGDVIKPISESMGARAGSSATVGGAPQNPAVAVEAGGAGPRKPAHRNEGPQSNIRSASVVDKPTASVTDPGRAEGPSSSKLRQDSGPAVSGGRAGKAQVDRRNVPAAGVGTDSESPSGKQAGWKSLPRPSTLAREATIGAERPENAANPQSRKKASAQKGSAVASGTRAVTSTTLIGAIVATVAAKAGKAISRPSSSPAKGTGQPGSSSDKAAMSHATGSSGKGKLSSAGASTKTKIKANPGQPPLPF